MKSIARWLATLSLVSSATLTFWCGQALKATALPEAELKKITGVVLFFGIADQKGNPLLFSIENQNNLAGMRVFVSQEDAQSFIGDLKAKQPNIANQYNQILPVSLDRILKIAQAQEQKEQRLVFDFEPDREQVDSAVSLLQAEDTSVKEFRGVPLFYATVTEGDKKEYLITEQGKVPFFFEKETLEQQLAEIKAQKPELAAKVGISVVALENVVTKLEKEDNPFLRSVFLVPSTDSREVLRSLQQQQNSNSSK